MADPSSMKISFFHCPSDMKIWSRPHFNFQKAMWGERPGCKRDIQARDRDETETFSFSSEKIRRPTPSKIYPRPEPRPKRFVLSSKRDRNILGRDRGVFRDLLQSGGMAVCRSFGIHFSQATVGTD